jgi:Type IV secretion-system coupling protein DNA-binding domain
MFSILTATVETLTHGWPGLAFSYATVQAPMISALARNRAQWSKWAWSPVWAIPMTIAAGLGSMITQPFVRACGFANSGLLQFAVDVGVSAAVGYLGGRSLARRASEDASHRRGTLIEDSQEPIRPRRSRDSDTVRNNTKSLTLAGVRIPIADETKHFKFIGTTGTGKSTAICEVLQGALRRGDRAIIADPDGGYLRRFYDERRGDVILNPFEPKSARWDLYGEIGNDYDVEQLARSLIPDHDGSERSWREYARTFFTAVVQQTYSGGVRDVREVYRLLVMGGTDELKVLLAGTPAQPFLDDQNARMFDSVRSVTTSAVGALQYIGKQQGAPLSVRDWVNNGKGVLFIPYRAGQIAALRSTISAWMRLAIFETMNREEGHRPLWFAIDELDALGKIDGLKDALARLRKFDGRCLLGLQSIAQVSGTFGHSEAQTIVENCGNTVIFRCSGSENGGTSRFASRLIGQREVLRTTESRSRRFMQWMPTVTRSDHLNIEPAVLDSEIEQLPDLRGYLKLASDPCWRRIALSPHQAAPTRDDTMPVPGNARRLWEALKSRESGRDPGRGSASSGAANDFER